MSWRFCVFAAATIPLLYGPLLHGAELRQASLTAWDQYVQSADAAMRNRIRAGGAFLWADEAPERRRQLRAGEILVTSVGESNPQKVPFGLIHHWMGAAFVPNTHIEAVINVVRDYAHYKDYYNPTVIDSKEIQHTADGDRFSTLLMNKSLLQKIAMESECESSYVQAGPGKWYSTMTTLHVQEIEDYGQRDERRLPFDQGSGFIWRLHTITRFEEGDGGVYIELEAMALSRDIPGAMRWLVDPIVRRVSKGSVIASLRRTEDAVNPSAQLAAKQPPGTEGTNPALAFGFIESSSRR